MIGLLKFNDQPAKSQRRFIAKSIQSLPHHSMMAASARAGVAPLKRLLNATSPIRPSTSILRYYNEEMVQDYVDVSGGAVLWHGTGRFQHGQAGTLKDVFKSIIDDGCIRPAHDSYAVLSGGKKMVTISMSRHRMVARCYADTHGRGASEDYRYGDSLHWAAYFYSTFYAELFLRNSVTVVHNWSAWRGAAADENGATQWGRKVNRRARYLWDVFDYGSDIPGNYPIVFGVHSHGAAVPVPSCFTHTEVRVADPIGLADMTHIEVPDQYVHDIQAYLLLKGCAIPVFPIELGEFVASRRPFSELVGRDRA